MKKNTFISNSAEYGGGVSIYNNVLIYSGNSSFRDNRAKQCGGGILAEGSTLTLTGNNIFRGNLAY